MLKEANDAYAATLTRTWEHDRKKTVGASEIGLCALMVSRNKQGLPGEPDQNWGARQRGNLIEKYLCVPAMQLKYGKDFLYGGDEQKTLMDSPLSATSDGLVINQKRDALKHLGITNLESDCFATEFKSIDPRANIEEEKAAHRMQAMVQLGIYRRKTEHKPVYAVISYIDASFFDTINEFVVKYDDKVYEILKKRAGTIMDPKVKQKPEGWIGGGHQCRYCPHLKACDIDRRALPFADKTIDPQRRAEIIAMCHEINTISSSVDRDTTLLKDKQYELKERLREFGVREIKGVLKWQSIKGRTSFDIEAMKKAKIKVEKFEVTGPATDRLTISKIMPSDM